MEKILYKHFVKAKPDGVKVNTVRYRIHSEGDKVYVVSFIDEKFPDDYSSKRHVKKEDMGQLVVSTFDSISEFVSCGVWSLNPELDKFTYDRMKTEIGYVLSEMIEYKKTQIKGMDKLLTKVKEDKGW